LQEQAKTNRADRNRLAALQRSQEKVKEQIGPKQSSLDDHQSDNVVPFIETSSKKTVNTDRKRFKTIT
jgi:putative transposase